MNLINNNNNRYSNMVQYWLPLLWYKISVQFSYIQDSLLEKTSINPDSIFYRINQTLLYLTFPIFRFMFNWYIVSLIWGNMDVISAISTHLFGLSFCLFVTIGLLNTLWLFRLFYSGDLFRGDKKNTRE